MARTEVSAVIREIIEAFQNGAKLSKGQGRRHRRRHSEPIETTEDQKTRNSLIKRPQEIQQVYEQSVVKHGEQFEVGDAASQRSLAQILLSFNTGLVKLLNQALSHDSKHRHSSSSSLLNLSESAGIETLSALSELNNRLTAYSKVQLPLSISQGNQEDRGKAVIRARGQSFGQTSKRPPPTPQLKNGAWVRSKSDPSVVSVVVPQKTRSEQRRGSASRSPNSPSLKTATMSTSTKTKDYETSMNDLSPVQDMPPVLKSKPKHLQASSKLTPVEERPSSAKELLRQPSMYIVPGDFFDMFPQLSEDADTLPPLMPPKIPLHSRPRQRAAMEEQDNYQRHARPVSMMTFMTDSTKIGEIPEHRLPDRDLTPEQQEEIPMPYVVPAMLNPPKRRTPRTFKFWKKDRTGKESVGSVLI